MRLCQADAIDGTPGFDEDDNVATALMERVLGEVS